ncbi:MAG: hypothetical protein J6R44_04140, partial [Clostridia bacterium]|nr:hypothetical protein [Clostridia bacterium]
MKKFFILILTLSFVFVAFLGCNKNDERAVTTADIFESFSSTGEYTSIEETLRLDEGVTVAFYNGANDVYVTKTTHMLGGENGVEREFYGFCSSTEVYIDPIYSAVIDIRGDYAICLRSQLSASENGLEEIRYVGVVKFRGGDGKAYEYGFTYPYAPLIQQFTFLSDN